MLRSDAIEILRLVSSGPVNGPDLGFSGSVEPYGFSHLWANGVGTNAACGVRHDRNTFMEPERAVRGQRFRLCRIQRRRRHMPGIQSCDQVVIHQMRTTPKIDPAAPCGQCAKVLGIQNTLCLVRERQQTDQNIRPRQKRTKLPPCPQNISISGSALVRPHPGRDIEPQICSEHRAGGSAMVPNPINRRADARQFLRDNRPFLAALLGQIVGHMAMMAQHMKDRVFGHRRVTVRRPRSHDRHIGHVRVRHQMINARQTWASETANLGVRQIGKIKAPDQQIMNIRRITDIGPETDVQIRNFREDTIPPGLQSALEQAGSEVKP